MPYLLGIDVSTTATKSLLINENGGVVATSASDYPFETPRPLWSEQDPALWWEAAIQSIKTVLQESGIEPAEILGIGLTGQMHGLVLLDEEGAVLRPAILWNDQRTAAQCEEIWTWLGKERLLQLTGNDALPGFTAPKILWVREQEPEVYAKIRHVLLPKDYVRYRLTGRLATDKADASGTLLLNLHRREWSPKVLAALDIPEDWLPSVFEGTEITGQITEEAASHTGLYSGTPVVAGGGDQAAQAVGVGAVDQGIMAITLGTSGVVFATTREPIIESQGRLHSFCHSVPDRWHLMGVMLSAAGSLRWYRDTFAPDISYGDLLEPAAAIQPGCEGLVFLPYLTGERTPYPDPLARGAFVGLTVRHSRAHMTRAVLEGVAFGLRDSFELMRSAGLPEIWQIRISGGGARSQLWRHILADILNVELVTVNTTEGAAYGAALLAGVSSALWPDVDAACAATIHITGTTTPNPENVPVYNRMHRQYRDLYPVLTPVFKELATIG